MKQYKQPSIEDYATIEGVCGGVPIYSFGNITYVYGVSPDLLPGVVMQEGNTNPIRKIQPKKSWEITSNLCGAEPGEYANRTMWNDDQPMLPIHLIDGDPDTAWCSFGGMVPDIRPEWIRIDLPVESTISSVALVCSSNPPTNTGTRYGKCLPGELTIKVSKDAWHWDTVYENASFSGDNSGTTAVEFSPVNAKQIMIIVGKLPKMEGEWSLGHVFSLVGVEVRDTGGENLSLISRGAGVTVSSVGRLLMHDRFTHDILWVPIHCDVGFKLVRVGVDNGMFTWNFVEREKGKLQVDEKADDSITDLHNNGVNIIMCLDIKANWLYKDPPQRTDWRTARFKEPSNMYHSHPGWVYESEELTEGYLRYIDYMARHFKGRVAYWEIGNECDYHADLIRRAIKTIRNIDPDTPIMLGSESGMHHFWQGESAWNPFTNILGCLCNGSEGVDPREDGLYCWGSDDVVLLANGLGDVDDVTVSVDVRHDAVAGIVLRARDADNMLVAMCVPHASKIWFYEKVNGDWGTPLDVVEMSELRYGSVHMTASAVGSDFTLTVTDGWQNVAVHHTTQVFKEAGAVGLCHVTTGRQMFCNFEVLDAEGKVLLSDPLNDTAVPIKGWDLLVGSWRDLSKEALATQLSAVGWHPHVGQEYPECWSSYGEAVNTFRSELAALGFRGEVMATEIYDCSHYPPGPPTKLSEMMQAKWLCRDMTAHNGINMMAGFANTYNGTVGLAITPSLLRCVNPVETINAMQPNPAYYALRTLCTTLDGFKAADFTANFSGETVFDCFTFKRDNGDYLVCAWIPGAGTDGISCMKTDVTLPSVKAAKAWVIDVMNGTEQELNVSANDSGIALRDVFIHDYPTFFRIDS